MNGDEEFHKLIASLGNLGETEDGQLTIAELSEFAQVLADVALHINRFISMYVRGESEMIPDFFNAMLPGLTDNLIDLSDQLHDMLCMEEDDDDEYDDEDEDPGNVG